jgi:uncharacterized DUF497 family protein
MHIEFDAAKNQANVACRNLSFEQIRVISFRKANAREVKVHDKKTRTFSG